MCVRAVIAGLFFTCLFGLSGHTALAEPCPVELHYVTAITGGQTYAVGFRSYTDGVADLKVTLFFGPDTYRVQLPRVTFTRPGPAISGSPKTWLSEPVYVALPARAKPLDAATFEIDDPDTLAALPCSGEHLVARPPHTEAAAERPDFGIESERNAESDAAVAAYTSRSRVVLATLQASDLDPTCPRQYVPVAVTHVVQPAYPSIARSLGQTGSALVMVEIGATGSVLSTAVYHTSGSPSLDAAAKAAAAGSTYRPEIFRCRPVAGSYLFQADFTGST